MILIWILSTTTLVSFISLVGLLTFVLKTEVFDKILFLLVGFAAGGLIGNAFLHLLPEALEQCSCDFVFFYTLVGFVFFFLMERYLYWRHCHEGVCNVHTFVYLNLMGDGVHNFTDGLIIAASFMTNFKLGIATTLAVIFHEIPQEMGDFGILVHGGFSKRRALFFNFLCALMAVLGALTGYTLSIFTKNISLILVPLTAGGFIYIAASDLIPELHREKETRKANMAFFAFILGITFIALIRMAME